MSTLIFRARVLAMLLVMLWIFLMPSETEAGGTWAPLVNGPPTGVNASMLLDDGTVLTYDGSGNCNKLTPDIHGSYLNGTWTRVAAMNDARLFFASELLTNGQVFVAGGEYGVGDTHAELYDPLNNVWTRIPDPVSAPAFSDAISKTLPNGNVLIAPVSQFGGCLIYNVVSNNWQVAASAQNQNEVDWVKLPNDTIITIDTGAETSEHYVPSSNQWITDGNVPVPVYGYGAEIGAGFLLPNGKVFYIGGTTNTAIYTPGATATSAGSWVAGAPMVFGASQLGAVDAPAAMMVNGKILCDLGPVGGFNGPCSFYEYDYTSNTFTAVNAPGGGSTYNSVPYANSMLDLPDGTVLFIGGQNSGSLYIYTPDGTPLAAGQPVINSITQNLDGSYHLAGTGLNGISEGAAYGDDEQMNGNYPLVRLTNNASGNVYYARTYNWSSTSVMTSNRVLTTEFALPQNLPAGTYSLVVTAVGNASAPQTFTYAPPAAPTGLTGTAGNAKAMLSWNTVSGATAYNLKRLTTTTPPYYATVATVTGTSCTNVGLVNGMSYFYAVTAVGTGGESTNSATVFLTPSGPPPVPASVTATPDTFARIDLAWTASYGATSYNIKRSTAHNGTYTNVASSVNPFYTDTGLASGVTYYYVISAASTGGESSNSIEASATAQSVANFGFEVPSIGGNYQYVPTGAYWTFSGTNGNGSGILGNGSGFGNPNAPEGAQAAFVQSNGVISQALSGFVPGTTYTVTYSAAQRSGASQNGGESWNVMIDNTVIQTNAPGGTSYAVYTAIFVATATTHTLSFVGTDLAGGDNTVFLDNVQISIVPPPIPNFSFETPSIGSGNNLYNPSGGSWTFTGASPNGSGLIGNGSGFSNPNAPLGVQAAFVQELGKISQTLSGFIPGKTYTIAYSAAQRPGSNQHGGESWNVTIDNVVIQTNSPGGTSYANYMATFVATATSHTLAFVGTDLATGDNTVFLDNVSITSPPQPVAPVVTLTAPTNSTLFTTPTTITLAATVVTNGNLISNVAFYNNATNLIGQDSTPPYSFNWSSPTAGNYSVFARVTYNGGSVMDSAAAGISVVNANVNFGFELPGIGSGNFQYNPSGGSWIFGGASGNGSGLVANGSAFANPTAPQGTQAAFIQGYGSITQTLTGFNPGVTYTITFSAAQRGSVQNGGESWNVMIDNTVITNFSPGGTSYATYTASFTATASIHTLAFVGTDLAGGDNTVFLDNVKIVPPIPPVAPLIALTAPANNATFTTPATVNLAATVTTNNNLINGVKFYFNSTNLIGQVTNTPYIYSWNNVSAGNYNVTAQVIYNNSSSITSAVVNIAVTNPPPPATPLNLSATTTNTQVMLAWTASAGAASYNVKSSTTNGGAYTVITNVAGTSYTNFGLTGGVTYYYVVSALNLGGESTNSSQVSVTPEALPPPWVTSDIGSVGVTGLASCSNGVFTVTGSGAGIAGAADAFRYVYQPVNGNCDIRARVTGVQNTSASAKAGVMLRETLSGNSANALMDVTPGNGLEFIWRASTGGNSSVTNVSGHGAPYWVRLVRNKNTFTAYRSPDGTTWTKVGTSQTILMATNIYVGMAVCAQNNAALCAAVFDNVTLPAPPTNVYTSPQLAASLPAGGGFTLQFQGVSDLNYTVETSTNLADWTAIFTNALTDVGTFIFTNASATDPVRFYQVIQ